MSEMTRMTIREERKVSRMMSVPDVNSFVMLHRSIREKPSESQEWIGLNWKVQPSSF